MRSPGLGRTLFANRNRIRGPASSNNKRFQRAESNKYKTIDRRKKTAADLYIHNKMIRQNYACIQFVSKPRVKSMGSFIHFYFLSIFVCSAPLRYATRDSLSPLGYTPPGISSKAFIMTTPFMNTLTTVSLLTLLVHSTTLYNIRYNILYHYIAVPEHVDDIFKTEKGLSEVCCCLLFAFCEGRYAQTAPLSAQDCSSRMDIASRFGAVLFIEVLRSLRRTIFTIFWNSK